MPAPRIIRDLLLRSWGAYAALGLQLLRGLLLAKLLTPDEFGVVAVVGVVLAYSTYADLGLSTAVMRELPVAQGANDAASVRAWRWYAIFFKLAAEAALSGVLLGIVFLRWNTLQPDLRFGLLTATCVCLLQGVVVAQQTIFEAGRQFGRGAALLAAFFGFNLVAGVTGALMMGTSGVFLGQIVASALAVMIGLALGGWAKRVRLQRTRVLVLARIGMPLALINFMGYSLVYVDQVMVATLFGSSALGTYMMVLYVGSVLGVLPLALVGVVSPMMMERYGAEGTIEAIGHYTWRPVRVLSLLLPPLIALAWIAAPAFISQILPLYRESIAPMRIYLTGLFFFCLNMGVGSTLLAINKHMRNVPIVVACIGVNIGLDLVFAGRLEWGLNGIALGSAITYFVYWMAHTTLVRRYYHERGLAAAWSNLAIGWPGLMLAALATFAWYLGCLGSSRPLAETIYLAPVLLMTAVRLLWTNLPELAGAGR